jgi:hypothetical protein
MSKTATRVSSKFRKDVAKVSKDKVGGFVVRYFSDVFAPGVIKKVRSGGLRG